MLGFVFALPFLIALVVFALSNTAEVTIGFWPTDLTIDAPLSLAILGCSAIFFLLGGLVVFIGTVAQRSRARQAERRARALQRELDLLRASIAPRPADPYGAPAATLPPPGTGMTVVRS